jgi:molybdenum cofactor cytidylyltransferase
MSRSAWPLVLVMAAGSGRRFGGGAHKLVQPLASGQSVLGWTLRQVKASGLPLLVVTNPVTAVEAKRHVPPPDVLQLSEAEAARGMGSSIAAGVAERPDARGWLVMPGDMPVVQAASLRAVAQALSQHAVAYAQYRGQRGHPVGFATELVSELLALRGDDGARRVLARFPSHGVELDDPGVMLDVDTPADLLALQQRAQAAVKPEPSSAA